LVDWDGKADLDVDYDAWGVATDTGIGPAQEHFRYRGGYADSDTGLVNFGQRWYDPHLGRWMSQDSLLSLALLSNLDLSPYAGDLENLYTYARNTPLNVADQTGLDPGFFRGLADRLGETAKVFVLICQFLNVGPYSRPKGPDPQEVVEKNKPGEKSSASGTGPDNDPPKPPENPALGPDKFLPVLPLPVNPTLPVMPEIPIFEPVPLFIFGAADPASGSLDASLDPSFITTDSAVTPSTSTASEATAIV
jgi:RHS repeat-associated protein